MWADIFTKGEISAEVPNCTPSNTRFSLLSLASDMPLLWESFFDMLDILREGPREEARPVCRREYGSLRNPPMETSFGQWNMSLLLQDENPIRGRIFAGNPNIRFFGYLPNLDAIIS